MSMYSFIAKNSKVPLFVQLKMAIINDIKTGKYENMQKLPSRRVLAKELGLSTTTVNNAYQALVDEGYAITIDRSGFFVKSNIHIEEYDDIVWEKNKNCSYNFSYNNCETININTILLKSFERQLRNNKFSDLSRHGNKRGEMDFRIAIAKFLRNRRNINCQISDIFLGAGLQYLLTVIVMIFGRDKVYGFENPTDHKMYIWLKNLGVDIRLVDVTLTSPLTPEAMEVNRYGMALCPFHNDRHPSLYVADDHYYCFACGEHGDVIDFVGRLFQLSPYDAARKLMADFHLSPDKPPSAAALHAKRIRTEAQQLTENERLCFSVLSDYARVLRDWKVRYAPQSPDAPVHARFMEACHKLDETEYYLDILCVGDSHERAEVVQQQMADGKLDRLRRRLEKIHKEELEDGYDTAGVA